MTSLAIYSGRELIGDGLQKLPVVRAARALFPDHRITWLTSEETVFRGSLAPLVEGLLDEVRVCPALLSGRRAVFRAPPVEDHFEILVDTQTSLWRSLALRRISHRLFITSAGRYLLSDRRPTSSLKRTRHVAQRLLLLLELAAGREADVDAVALTVPDDLAALAAELLPEGPSYLGLAPGAGRRVKCWPLERFIEVGQWHAARGGTPVFFVGPDEAEWLPRLRSALPQAVFPEQAMAERLPGFSPLRPIALGRRLGAALSNDSGVGNMLAACDVPLLTLFGPTDPEKFAPLTRHGSLLSAQAFGGIDMAAIPTAAVVERLETLLPARAQAPASAGRGQRAC